MGYGKNNKRRGPEKAKGRVKKNQTKYKSKFIANPTVVTWDHQKTLRQNYEKLGLTLDPNADTNKKVQPVTEFFDVPDSDLLCTKNYSTKQHHMNQHEIKYLTVLVEAYGEEYEKMHRDIKLNHLQWTLNKLKRRIARMKLHQANLLN